MTEWTCSSMPSLSVGSYSCSGVLDSVSATGMSFPGWCKMFQCCITLGAYAGGEQVHRRWASSVWTRGVNGQV